MPAENLKRLLPEIGAEVWIEPGQKESDIDGWMGILADNHFSVARLFIIWNYVETSPGNFDFSLYDFAFDAAQQHGIKIEATLTPNHGPAFVLPEYFYNVQGDTIPRTNAELEKSKVYIEKTVSRYRNHPALDYWWLINEPGQTNVHDYFTVDRYKEWLKNNYGAIDGLNKIWNTAFADFNAIGYNEIWDHPKSFTAPASFLDWNLFWRENLTWYLGWIADEIRKYDLIHPLHTNPHALFDNLYRYDLPGWSDFLGSIGASVHPSWHFGLLERDQFAFGLAAVCEIIKGAGEPHPFWISEIQGGNNIWSASRPLCPDAKDIAQWVWVGIGSGAEKILFWSLNARTTGGEAGEWSLLDFQNQPTERTETISDIAGILQKYKDFFSRAKPLNPLVTILLSPETMLIEARKDLWHDYDGRRAQAHVISALAIFQTFQELGIPVAIKLIDDFDWENDSVSRFVVLPDMIALTAKQAEKTGEFVKKGNRLLVTGLTGYFDENEHCTLYGDFPLKDVLGGTIREINMMKESTCIDLTFMKKSLPVHYWKADMIATTGIVEGIDENKIMALRNYYGKGETFWIPSMITLEAWQNNNNPLADLLKHEITRFLSWLPFHFADHEPGALMKVLTDGKQYVAIVANNHDYINDITLYSELTLKSEVIYGPEHALERKNIHLGPHETIVILFG